MAGGGNGRYSAWLASEGLVVCSGELIMEAAAYQQW